MQNITILGATGSIGDSTLKVVAQNSEKFNVFALAAGTNVSKMHDLSNKLIENDMKISLKMKIPLKLKIRWKIENFVENED